MTLEQLIIKHLGFPGKMISMSKSTYREAHPNNIVYFNACIFNKDLKQIWWGDIDITKNKKKLQKIAEESKELFYVTPEHPFRSDFNKVDQKLIDTDESVIRYNDESV